MHFKTEKNTGRQGADTARHAQEQGKYSGSDANTGAGKTPNDFSSDPKRNTANERSIIEKTSKPTDGEQIDEE